MKKYVGILAFLATTSAFADDIHLGMPAYGGNGCPQGSASYEVTPDGNLKLQIDPMKVEAGAGTGNMISRKNCNLAFPIHVPTGLQIGFSNSTLQGYASLSYGAKLTLDREVFFAGQRGPTLHDQITGPYEDQYLTEMEDSATVWSGCGQDTNLRVNTSATIITNRSHDPVTATVEDLGDIRFQVRECD